MICKRLIPAVLPLLLAACTTFQAPPDDARRTWDLNPALPTAVDAPIEATIHVARPTAVSALAGADMAYRQSEFEQRYYARNRWADDPGRLLHPRLVSAFEEAGLFETVLSSSTSAPAHYRLETELLALEHDFRERDSGRARVEIRARVVDLRESRVVATRRFQAAEDSAEATPEAGVVATNAAMATVFQDLVDWIHGQRQ
ncbi:ABC-type transport auxiliary lipoprotein family protein [Aquisalimonas asiatica]|uniref:Cholesterol transport system auxiliary component n=1 Tax=Aquisalimonas asiatica TaxID=406100 RepID=A0A1H8Q7R4_9GAMM|nr:ABC-type transport auxiliary lipoprotein family protein [Aquisalimonas asiatica]SEO50096.1 cholesterol transport system auxiliary component [Aquisalimonas asiatica]